MSETRVITVDLGAASYDVLVGEALLPRAGELVSSVLGTARGVLITDGNVAPLYAQKVAASLEQAGIEVGEPLVVEPGEGAKELRVAEGLLREMATRRLYRDAVVVALGGGVVGDLSGFVASMYMRGVRWVQLPTTLLCQVDASVGGKTAVNLPEGKNLVGAFHQPSLVVADVATLETLDARQWRSGLSELIKAGCVGDAALFERLRGYGAQLATPDWARDVELLHAAVAVKARIVEADEREAGLRAVLNLGHTFGHALEQATGYGSYLHGEAVAVGMVVAARMSVKRAGLSTERAAQVEQLLSAAGLPTDPDVLRRDDVRDALAVDKKGSAGGIRAVFLEDIGRATLQHLSPVELWQCFEDVLQS